MPLFYNRDFEHVNASSSSGNDGSFQIPQDAPLPRPEFQYPYLHWPSYPYYYWPSYSHQEPPSGALERGNSDRLNYTGFDHWSHDNQGEGYGDDDWFYSDHASESLSTSRESKPPSFLEHNALGLVLERTQDYNSDRTASLSNGIPRIDERQTLQDTPTPHSTVKQHPPPFTVEQQGIQPLSTTGNPSASRSEPSAQGKNAGSTSTLSAETVEHGPSEGSGGSALVMETKKDPSLVVKPETREEPLPCDNFPEPVWLNGPTPGPSLRSGLNPKLTRPISITSEASAATSSVFSFASHSSTSDWVHPPFVPALSRLNVTAKPVRPISAVSEASSASSATFSFASHSPSVGSVRSHGSFDSVDSTSTVRPSGELHSVNETQWYGSSATFSSTTHVSSDWVYPPSVRASSRNNVIAKPVRPISTVSEASSVSSATFSFASRSPSVGSVRSHGSFDSVDSTSTVRPPGRPDFVNDAKSPVTLTPKQSTAATSKPVDASVDASISPLKSERSAPNHGLSSVENKPNHDLGHLTSAPGSTSRVLGTPRLSFSTGIWSRQPSIPAGTAVSSPGCTVLSASPTVASSSSATPRLPGSTPITGSSGSGLKSSHSHVKSQPSTRRGDQVVNKITQYVEISDGPLRMLPNYGATIAPVIDNNQNHKPTIGSTIAEGAEGLSTTGDASTAPQTGRATQESALNQGSKPSETLNLCSRCAATIESTSSTSQATAGESNNHPKQSSGSLPPSNYHIVDYEEHRGYYYVILGNEKGEEVGHMILRK